MGDGVKSAQPNEKPAADRVIFGFGDLTVDSTSIAGGKGASLARMTAAGLPVPPGFIVCASALKEFLAGEGLSLIQDLTAQLDVHDSLLLNDASSAICDWVLSHPLPEGTEEAIRSAYSELGKISQDVLVAVRSSGVSEDGEAASFAGQQETFLNVRGTAAVVRHVQECWASFFTPRALFYRAQKGVLTDTSMAVVVQQMVLAEKSGVMFTVDPVQKRRDRMVIEAVFGLGEGIVSGLITPDHYEIDRDHGSLLDEFIAIKSVAIVCDDSTGRTTEIELEEEKGASRVLSDLELGALREMGLRLEAFFGRPQDVEWSIRGDQLLLLQSRPITTL